MNLLPVLMFKFKKNSTTEANILDILNEIEEDDSTFWIIQQMELLGQLQDTEYAKFASKAWELNACLPIKWSTMMEIAPKIDWVIWMNLIGFKEEEKVRVYSSDFELLKNCYIGIFRFDGEYWEVFTQDENFYSRLLQKFEIFKLIPAEEYVRSS